MVWNKPPRDPARIPGVLVAIGDLWRLPANQDLRAGQLLLNVLRKERPGLTNEELEQRLWSIEDDALILLLRGALEGARRS